MPWDVDKSIDELEKNARGTSSGNCAKFVRQAIEAGGLPVHPVPYAKDYGRSLEIAGFRQANRFSCVVPKRGDVAVIQPVGTRRYGHMAMFNGTQWISDFKQREMYPGPEYRAQQPEFVIYRRD